jgi:hypothetical protein
LCWAETPHDVVMAATALLDHLLDDVRAVAPPWLPHWLPHVELTAWKTTQCLGPRCDAASPEDVPSPVAVAEAGATPRLTVSAPASNAAPAAMPALLTALGAPETFGHDPRAGPGLRLGQFVLGRAFFVLQRISHGSWNHPPFAF